MRRDKKQPESIMDCIFHEWTAVMEPLAHDILEEKMDKLGMDGESSLDKIPELIELLGLEISDPTRRTEFEKQSLKHYDRLKDRAFLPVKQIVGTG